MSDFRSMRPANALNDHMREIDPEWNDLEVTEQLATPEGVWNKYEVRKQLRQDAGYKSRKNLWDATKLDYWQVSGNRMGYIKDCEPLSFQEWAEYYFKQVPWEEFILIGEAWAKVAGLTTNQGIAECLMHLVDYPWEGMRGELIAKGMMEDYHLRKGQSVEFADEELDYKYAIDIIVGDGEKLLFAVQVKSPFFFTAPNIQWERDAVKNKHKAFKERYGVPVYFINTTDVFKGNLLYIPSSKIK